MRLLHKLEGKFKHLFNLRNLVFLIIFVTFLCHSYQLLTLFLEYQTTVYITEDDRTKVDFPAITGCTKDGVPNYISRIWKITREITNIMPIASELSCYKMKKMDTISGNCYYHRRANLFTNYYRDEVYGNCYTFNSVWSKQPILKAFEPSSDSSSLLSHKKNQLKFMMYLPNEKPESIAVWFITFHSPQVAPNIRNFVSTRILKPGYFYEYYFTRKSSLLLPRPFRTNCTDYEKMSTTAARGGLLDKELCQMECLENITYTTCNSVNYFISPFAYESGLKLQRITLRGVASDISCYEKVVQNKKVFNYCETVCRQPCRKIIYETKQKRSYWKLVKEESKDKDVRDWIYMLNRTMNWTLSKEFIDTKLLFVSIQSGSSEHLVYKYFPRFQTLEIISYFGSILGLWIGYSIVRIGGIMAILMLRLGDKIKVYEKDKDIMNPIRRVITFILAYLSSKERS